MIPKRLAIPAVQWGRLTPRTWPSTMGGRAPRWRTPLRATVGGTLTTEEWQEIRKSDERAVKPCDVSHGASRANSFGEFDPGSGLTLAACMRHASRTDDRACSIVSGGRLSNAWVTCPEVGNNCPKGWLIPHVVTGSFQSPKPQGASGGACVRLARWWGNGSPRRRSVGGLRGRSPRLGLRHGPDSYGRQQSGILLNGRKPEAATPREG